MENYLKFFDNNNINTNYEFGMIKKFVHLFNIIKYKHEIKLKTSMLITHSMSN